MTLLDRLEKRFGRYAVENVTLILIGGQVMVFLAQYLQPGGAADLYAKLALDPQLVYQGEVWRLLTFVFLAPLSEYPIFVIFFWWLFYMMGTALEQSWSAFRYNVFLGIGYFASIAATMLVEYFQPGAGIGLGDYLYGSVFLAFARLYPNFEILLFFILPVKVRWLALITWIFYGLQFVFAPDWLSRVLIVMAVLNYLIFFGRDIVRDAKQGHRRMQHQAKTLRQPEKVTHECRVCGLTREMAPKTAFRYCSECDGQCCYCPDHIRNHEHVRQQVASTEGDG